MHYKIGIFSITLNRLYYTYHCFKSFKNTTKIFFEHIVIDNGSTDGTYEWLKEEKYNVIRNINNKGITKASLQGFNWLKNKNIDIIIKVDSDCEFLTLNILEAIDDLFFEESKLKKSSKLVISPIVLGIDTKLKIVFEEKLGKNIIKRTSSTGGIFRAMRIEDFEEITKKLKILNDETLNNYFAVNQYKIGYLSGYTVNHFETTKGQEKRYPEYFNKKYIY